MYKYKINESLELLPLKEHTWAVENIPEILDISPANFNRFRGLKIDDRGDIPYVKVRLLESFFGLGTGTLLNKKIESKTLKELLNASIEESEGSTIR